MSNIPLYKDKELPQGKRASFSLLYAFPSLGHPKQNLEFDDIYIPIMVKINAPENDMSVQMVKNPALAIFFSTF